MALRAAVAAVLLLLAPLGAWAQGMAVRGVVNDETGEPVIGASVSVKGTTNGAKRSNTAATAARSAIFLFI